jgi:hypothetical protein
VVPQCSFLLSLLQTFHKCSIFCCFCMFQKKSFWACACVSLWASISL